MKLCGVAWRVTCAVGICLAAAPASWALDSVRIANKPPITGRVKSMSPLEVEVEQGAAGSTVKQVAVNEILTILYDDDPSALKTAKARLAENKLEEALTALDKVDADQIARREIVQDVEFYRAYCHAQLALGGTGEIKDAGKEMAAFVRKHEGSYHWLKANEIVGDLLVAIGQFNAAEPYYAKVAKAPWPDYQMRAGVAMGRALLAQNKTAEALKAFEAVLATPAEGDLAQAQYLAATLGRARVLAQDKKPDEAIKIAEGVIQKADPEQASLLAHAYNTLGAAYRAAGRNKEALMAYLHVDVLYSRVPEAHAEALYNLVPLWNAAGKPDRATQARNVLEQQYKNSPWARK